MNESSHILLNRAALQSNWDFLRSYFKDKRISAVVKGNAYGHGIEAYVPMAEACGVDHFSVYNAAEAFKVHEAASPGTTIMIMGLLENRDVEWAISNDIEFFVFNIERLDAAIAAAAKLHKKALVHIEVETGMYRTGFEFDELPAVEETLRKNKDKVVFKGLCMHFAGAENIANHKRIKRQKEKFREAVKFFKDTATEPELLHTCCSAAAVRLPDMHYDLLRIGIMQYGFWPSPEIMIEYLNTNDLLVSPLKRIISWESFVMSLKDVPADEYVGYGSSYFAHKPIRIALVPIGYAHGFSRSLSNTGLVIINGWRTQIVGMVNMNCIAVDVTHLPEIGINDRVTLIGSQGKHEISVASFGEMSNQPNYELLTRLPVDISRYAV